jgi:hypothetical protein
MPESSSAGGTSSGEAGTKIPSGKTQLGVALLGLGNYAETRLAPG